MSESWKVCSSDEIKHEILNINKNKASDKGNILIYNLKDAILSLSVPQLNRIK